MAGGYPKVDIYGYRGFGPVGVPTLSGGSYYPNAWDVLDNVNGSLLGSVGSLGINAISEPSFQSGAFSSRVVSTGALDSSAITNALIDKIIARFVQKDTAGAGYTFGTTSLGKLFSQTGAQSLDSQIVSRIVWGIVWGVAKTANNTDTSQVAGRTVSGLSVTIDSAQISRIVKRVVWGIASGSGSDSTSAAQRVISFDIATLVNAIWNELKSGHNVTGSFGSFVDARISSVSGASGNGAYSWDVYLVDTSASPDSVIQNAQVWINNPAQNTQPYWAITDNTGKGHFQLNAGSWVTFTTEPGFGQTLRAFSMSGSGRDTLKLYKGNTGRSMLALYGGLGSGTRWDSSRVEIELVSVNDSLLMVGDTVIASNGKGFITAYTNHFGQATIPLYSNETFTNDSTYYRMSVRDMRRGKLLSRFAFRMPTSSATVWLKDVTTWREN
jgi:hypothetical protein